MISGTTIIRNGLKGSYPFVEAILAILPVVDEFIVMNDSQDGTTEVLEKMARKYGKIKIFNEPWRCDWMGPTVISYVTNRSFERCQGEWIIHCQADEVFTPHAVEVLYYRIQKGDFNAFLMNRRQTGANFQFWHGAPCSPTRAGRRGNIESTGDGLTIHVKDCHYDFLEPGSDNVHIFDVTRTFMGNFPGRSDNQAEIWWMNPNRNAGGWFDKTPEQWTEQVRQWENEGWPEEYLRTESPLGLPPSLQYWVGKPYYFPRPELVEP